MPLKDVQGSEDDARMDDHASKPMQEEKVSTSTDSSKIADVQEDPNNHTPNVVDVASDADTSEGEEVDFLGEFRRKYEDLQKRIGMTPKRAKQMYQYAAIMEERVRFLEEQSEKIAMRLQMQISKGKIPGKADDPQRVLEFKLNHQLWQDFKAMPSEKDIIHVIDILIEEPEYYDEESFDPRGRQPPNLANPERPNQRSPKASEKAATPTAAELNIVIESLRGNYLPERVRFNSYALQHILRKHFHPGAGVGLLPAPGYIMLRPFKALLHFEEDIRGLWSDLKKMLNSMRLTDSLDSIEDGNPSADQNGLVKETKSGCQQDPERSLVIDKDTWSSIFKKLKLFQSDESSQLVASEWHTDEDVTKTFDCLFELIDNYLKPVVSPLRQRIPDKVRFDNLWHLFRSDDEIVTKDCSSTNKAMVMRVLRTNGGRRHIHPGIAPLIEGIPEIRRKGRNQLVNGINPFSIHAWYIDFDGINLTPVRRHFVIQPYVGERPIADLHVYPVVYAKDSAKLKADLMERGKNFVKFATSASAPYCDCQGEELVTKEELNDKVIVDMKEFGKHGSLPQYSEPDALDLSETSNCNRGSDCTLGPHCYHNTARIIHDQYTDKTAMKDHIATQPIFQQLFKKSRQETLELSDDDYAICTYRLFAYKLRSREWIEVHVDSLTDATRVDDGKGFERLVLPAAHKHIVRSQVKEHFRKKNMHTSATQDDLDLVRGKGQGLIILLHGAPGVGKTCTAETIADLVHKPLYPITCGDLGSTALDVEENLKKHFTLASRWDCVMLLDEADVFLAKRIPEDLHRNSIVSVFLRIMEYYKGLLFLTTNRVGTFDEAFKSRVHISLFYANFDRKTTIRVWKTFIRQTKEAIKKKGWKHFKINDEEIYQFAEDHWEENPATRWNGRQIRNAFHTAIAMAEFDARAEGDGQEPHKIVLGRDQFEKIASTVRDFDKYMIDTMGTTFEEEADKNRLRKFKPHAESRKGWNGGKKSSKKARKQRYLPSSEESESSTNSEDRKKKSKASVKGLKNKVRESDDDADSDSDSPISESN